MKFTYILSAAAIFLSVQAQVSWYVSSKDITCSGHEDGHIDCVPGNESGAPEVPLDHPTSTPRRSALDATALEKRVTCNIDGVTQGLACFTHCFGIGYCNSHCDGNNICHCTCMDKTPWWNPIVCSKTSCA